MISKTAIHAVKALAVLAELPEGAYEGAATIARKIDARQNYLGKLLQTLSHQGLVASQKGLGGGFRLARDPKAITLFDVVDPIDHISRWNGCVLGRNKCSDSAPCALHLRWGRVREAYMGLLLETTIAELAGHPSIEQLIGVRE